MRREEICILVTARVGGDGEGDDEKHSEEGAQMVAYGVPLEG